MTDVPRRLSESSDVGACSGMRQMQGGARNPPGAYWFVREEGFRSDNAADDHSWTGSRESQRVWPIRQRSGAGARRKGAVPLSGGLWQLSQCTMPFDVRTICTAERSAVEAPGGIASCADVGPVGRTMPPSPRSGVDPDRDWV